MSKPGKRSPERKLQVVLSVLRGEVWAADAARRAAVAEQTVHNWKRAFLEAARAGLAIRQRRREPSNGPSRLVHVAIAAATPHPWAVTLADAHSEVS